MAPKDIGIKIAQAGYDADTAADYQLLFNSAWPSLTVAFDKTVHVAANASVTVSHNLGFYPLCFAYVSQNGTYLGRLDYAQLGAIGISIGLNNIYMIGDFANDYDVNVVCYNVDLTKPADYTQPLPSGLQGTYSPDFGLKLVKSGRDIDSTDLRDFIVHTRAQSPALLAVLTETSGVPNGAQHDIIYNNPAGIVNWVYGFLAVNGTIYENKVYQPAGFAVQTVNGVSIIGSQFKLTYTSPGGTIVVLRDPLFGSNNVTVNY